MSHFTKGVFVLAQLVRSGRIPRLEVVVDSLMASAVTDLTLHHSVLWDDDTRELLAWTRSNSERFSLRFVADVEESMALNHRQGGLVIISARGMCDAGLAQSNRGRQPYKIPTDLGRVHLRCAAILE